ncbi:helicase protein MOM1 isoform X2 [Humulus lupulus]|uniref:helicase protein MOM1 isoform X2 n=1 Tax=Humulus lupulus TaxID=3486 RepID=UPI002B40CFCB|nr:helicase protein MOM1 isoform X2 [Humulus lupulus]
MGNDARPSRQGKDDETSNLKGKQSSDKGLSTSSSATSDTFGLRRSSRETSEMKKVVPSVRKSERLEKRVPMTPPEKGKSEKVEKKLTPSPLRRSDRGKSSVSPSSVSKNAANSSSLSPLKRKKKKKSKKEKSVRQLTLETKKVDIETQDQECRRVKKKRKRLDAQTYMGAFKTPKAKKVKAKGNETMEDKDGGKEASGSSMEPGYEKEAFELEDGDALGASSIGESATATILSNDNDTRMEKIIDEPDTKEVDSTTSGKANEPKLMDSSFSKSSMEDQVGRKSDQEIMPSTSKRIMLDESSNALGKNASMEVCTTIAHVAPVEKVDSYSSRQRVDLDSTGGRLSSDNLNLNQEIAATFSTMDRGEREIGEKCDKHMQQKKSPEDLQIVGEQYTCFTCKVGGRLLCCHGRECKRSYHPTCLDPPMDDVPLGVWYCLMCVRKKLESGVHSVSEGVESICDDRVVEVLDVDGLQKEREFFVKYKGLAHIHNLWVPESKLLLDAPSLVEKFNRENQVRWKPEWKVPHRLLQKRLLISPKRHDQNTITNHACKKLDGHYEWLVKWCGLEYEHATWELDDTLLSTSDGKSLIKDYENRHSRVNEDSSSKKDKILESEKFLQLHSGRSSQFCSECQDYNNKLHEFWLKGPNAVVIDEQERILKVASLIQSFRPNCCQPFLIISTSAALHLWDDGFLQFVNVVVYNGNKDLRRSIRKLEFDEGGCPMFQVLITTLDIVMEEMDVFRSIEWELIIIDECQCPIISSHYVEIKHLTTKRRLLLVSGQLKETIAEYRNLLSLLESRSDSQSKESLLVSSCDNIGKLKEKFLRYVAYQSKSGSSRFNEYWVPVQMSNVQLEVYCSTLISNSTLLCSSPKNIIVGSVHDILKSCRKCCNHPYLADSSIIKVITKDLQGDEYYTAGIKACGKLQLLHMMLLEIQKRGLRVLILFPGTADLGTGSLGNILEDLLITKFGDNFYERVDYSIKHSKKIAAAAASKFNNESERFVFLIENRACNSSIKLFSIDIVIIYSSDWNPVNDVRALQKITLDLKSEQVTTFRLYTPYTLEEKVLLLAKQGKSPDGKLPNISLSMSHMLLMWGTAHLFKTLDKFHGEGVTTSSARRLFKEPSLEDVIKDLLQIISSDRKGSESSIIMHVPQVGGIYRTESLLYSELQSEVMDKVQPHLFWTEMLEGKHPQWKYIPNSSQRNRKRVHYSEETANNTETESDEIFKKRKKLVNGRVDPPPIDFGSDGKTVSSCKEGAFGTTTDNQQRRKMLDAQKSLHLSLKPELLKLCKILKLSDPARGVVEKFLEYVMNNHLVNRESNTTLQAFQISLCWTVTSLLKQKIDHKESLELARQHLNFECKIEEAEHLYSMLSCLKNIFSYRIGKLKYVDSPKVPILTTTDTLKDLAQVNGPLSVPSNTGKVKVGVEDCTGNLEYFDKVLCTLAEKDVIKSIKEIQKMFQKKLEKLIQKLKEEKNEIEQNYEEGKTRIQKNHKLKRAALLACFEHNTSMREYKLKLVDNSFAKELEEVRSKRDMCVKNLETNHIADKKRLQERESHWVKEVESWAHDELLGKAPMNEAVTGLKCSQTSEQVRVEGSGSLKQNTIGPVSDAQVMVPADPSAKMCIPPVGATPSTLDGKVTPEAPENGAHTVVAEKFVSTARSSCEAQILDKCTSFVPETASSTHDVMIVDALVQMSAEEQIPHRVTLNVPEGGIPFSVLKSTHLDVDIDHSGEKNDEICNVTSNGDAVINQQDRVDNAFNQNSHFREPSLVNPCVQPAVTLTDGEAVSPNQVHLDECDSPPISCGPQCVDAQPANKQNALEEVEQLASEPIDLSTQSVDALEPAAQVHVSQSNSAVIRVVEESGCQPSDEGFTSIQVSHAPVELVENSQFSNQAVSYPITSSINASIRNPGMHVPESRTMSVASESINHLAQPMPPVVSWVGPPLNPDPLQMELERLCQEFDQTRKSYDDTKLHLKCDHEKEIAEINKKYETMNREIDNEFYVKNKNFDDLRSKLWLNKILAEAFRSKCEYRSIDRTGMHQDVNAAVMQHLVQLHSMQQNAQRPPFVATSSASPVSAMQNVQRPIVVTSSASPATTVQNAQRPLPVATSASPATTVQNAQRPLFVATSSASPATTMQNVQRPIFTSSASPGTIMQNVQRPIVTSSASPATTVQTAQRPPIVSTYSASPATTMPNAQRPLLVPTSSVSPATTLQNAQRPLIVPTSSASPATTVKNTHRPFPVPTSSASPATTVPVSGCELNSQPSLPASVISSNNTPVLASGCELNPQLSLPTPVNIPHTTTPVPTVNPSSAPFPSTTTRPPQISSLSYSTGNLQGSGQIRSRPPHLRASIPNLPSHPGGIQTQPTTSPASAVNALPNLPLPLQSSVHQSGPSDRALRPEVARELPTFSRLSALELLRKVDRRAAASQPFSSPAVPDLVSNIEGLNTSELSQSSRQVNSIGTGGPTDVVYLSDDD